jgi:colanic acid biosynthesis glycosyl transferase WcaI
MDIVYICQYFPPEMGAPAARASELARYWTRAGHNVTVLTGFPNHPTGVLRPEYRSRFRRLVCREDVDGINVVRTWLAPFPNRKAHERILNYSSFCLSAAATGSFLPKPDVIIATSPQLLVGLSGWWMKTVKRVPLVFEVRDLWPESLAGVGMGGDESTMVKVLGKVAGFMYSHCDHVVVVTPAFKDALVANWKLRPERISIVENGVEPQLFSPGDTDARKAELGLQGKFVVSYIGTMGMAHGLTTLVEAAERLRAIPEVQFLLVGEGADKERVGRILRERGLENVRMMDQQPREKIPAIIQASDVCLVLLKKADVFQTVIPTKMLEFMSCGRPIILGVDGQARKIMDAANAGVFVRPEDAVALSEAICHLRIAADLREQLGRNGRRYIVENLSREQTASRYIEVLHRVVSSRRDLRAAAVSQS